MVDKVPGRQSIILSASTCWYLWNFRRNLISALAERNWKIIAVAPEDESTAEVMALPGSCWIDWPLALDGARPWQELMSLLRFAAIVKQVRPQFILNHGIKPNVYGGLISRTLRIPYANCVTGLGTLLGRSGIAPRGLSRLYAFACSAANTVFVQNQEDLAFLYHAGLPKRVRTVRTMGSGVNLSHFAPKPMPSSTDFVFLYVGRLQRDKGIWEFVEAAKKLHLQNANIRFVAVGSRRHANRSVVPDETLQQWISEGVVEFPGHQEDVRPWLSSAHAVILPSWREGMPRVILEAAATGRLAVASDVPGCRDAVIDGKTGFLFPVRDTEALIRIMRTIVETPWAVIVEMGRSARADAEKRFSDTDVVEAVIECVRPFEDTHVN